MRALFFRSFVCFTLSPTYVFFLYSPPNDEQTNRHTRFEQEETRVERQNSTGCARYRATREKSRGEQKEAKTGGKLNRSRRSSEEKNFGDFQARGDAPKESRKLFYTRTERRTGTRILIKMLLRIVLLQLLASILFSIVIIWIRSI